MQDLLFLKTCGQEMREMQSRVLICQISTVLAVRLLVDQDLVSLVKVVSQWVMNNSSSVLVVSLVSSPPG